MSKKGRLFLFLSFCVGVCQIGAYEQQCRRVKSSTLVKVRLMSVVGTITACGPLKKKVS